MPKIKVKNIPDATYKRICTNCIKCSRAYCFQFDVVKIPGGYVHYQSDVVELSEQEFPTNREWLESLSNFELAALMTSGYTVKDGKLKGLNATTNLMTDINEVKEWLSQPCAYLMEEE